MPEPTKYLDRPIPTISLADFDDRIDEITSQLVSAAENIGFFSIIDHGISPDQVHAIFTESARFFSLPDTIKASVPFSSQHNAGWESKSQIRPSTGAADNKESYQMQFSSHHMSGKWLPDSILPNFQPNAISFMHQCQTVSAKLMICFARGLGFPDTYFLDSHDSTRPDCQTVCRLLHYFETPRSVTNGETQHRAGAHTDWDLLTLLFQKEGQSGLEICPGREASTDFAIGDIWTKVEPSVSSNAIICNIGDLLMSWSDDRFKSTFHRVKAPEMESDYWGERYSVAFFNQPCRDVVIQGPGRKYPVVSGEEFTRRAMERNFRALEEKRRGVEGVVEVGGGLKEVSVGA